MGAAAQVQSEVQDFREDRVLILLAFRALAHGHAVPVDARDEKIERNSDESEGGPEDDLASIQLMTSLEIGAPLGDSTIPWLIALRLTSTLTFSAIFTVTTFPLRLTTVP